MAPSQTATRRTPPAAPLTTVFTQPRACSTLTDRFETSVCMPPNWSRYRSDKVGYYSPGLCPESYHSDCSRPATGSFGPPLVPGETAVVCCPDQYSCATDNASYCYKDDRFAFAIQVRYRSSDVPVLAKASSSFFASATATPGASGRPAQTSAASDSNGLSTGEKAAIGVVVPVVVLSVLAGIIIFLWRRRRKSRGGSNQLQPTTTNEKLNSLNSPETLPPQSPQLEHVISTDGSMGFSPTTDLPLAATLSNYSPEEYVVGRRSQQLPENIQPVIVPASQDRSDDDIQPVSTHIPQPYPTPFLVRSNTDQTGFGFSIDRSIQATPTQAYARPVPLGSLVQCLPTTPEAREENEAPPVLEKDPHGVYSTVTSSPEEAVSSTMSSDPTSITSLLGSNRQRTQVSPVSPGSSRDLPDTFKYTTDVTVTEVEPLSPLVPATTVSDASPASSPVISQPTECSGFVSPITTMLSAQLPPRLARNHSELAPMPISPPGHVYPEAVSVQFPFPAPSAPPQVSMRKGLGGQSSLHLDASPVLQESRKDILVEAPADVPDQASPEPPLAHSSSTSPRSPNMSLAEIGDDDGEVRRLRSKRQRLRKRRARLSELAALDEEEAKLQKSLEDRLRKIGSQDRRASEASGNEEG